MQYALLPFKRILDFSGRSRRKEYWHFFLLVIVIFIVASLLDTFLGLGGSATGSAKDLNVSFNIQGGLLAKIWSFVQLLVGISLGIRRLHDTNRTGWWILIVLIPLIGWITWIVFMCLDGTSGSNRFGPSPKATDA